MKSVWPKYISQTNTHSRLSGFLTQLSINILNFQLKGKFRCVLKYEIFCIFFVVTWTHDVLFNFKCVPTLTTYPIYWVSIGHCSRFWREKLVGPLFCVFYFLARLYDTGPPNKINKNLQEIVFFDLLLSLNVVLFYLLTNCTFQYDCRNHFNLGHRHLIGLMQYDFYIPFI